MKDFTEALCAHFDDHSPFESWDTAHIIQAIRRFDAQWRPAPAAPGVDTSPAALRAAALTVGFEERDLLRAVADEKEAHGVRLTGEARIEGWRMVQTVSDEAVQRLGTKLAREHAVYLTQASARKLLEDAIGGQAQASAWRPMSEAPRDGSVVVLCWAYKGVHAAEAHWRAGEWELESWHDDVVPDALALGWVPKQVLPPLPAGPAQEGGE